MRFKAEDPNKRLNVISSLRDAGYHPELNRKTGQISYVRSLGGEYPRFHIYLEEFPDGWSIDLHLDQKRPSYGGSHAHSGEYDGEVVSEEAVRLKVALGAKE